MLKRLLFICLFLSSPNLLFAQDKALSEEDILLAELHIAKINHLDDQGRANYQKRVLGIDKRVNKVIEEAYVCDDVCPNNGSVYLRYKGIDTEKECNNLGHPKYSPGWHGYAGCMPKPVKVNIYLLKGEKIENVNFLDKTDFFLRVDKDAKGMLSASELRSIFLNDIDYIETTSGKKLNKFLQALSKPAILNNNQEQARIYFKAGIPLMQYNPQEAVFLLRKVIELNPVYFEAYYKLAELYKKSAPQEQAKEIIPLFEKLIKLNPDDAEAYFLLGEQYRERAYEYSVKGALEPAYLDKAREVFEKAVNLKPDFADAYERLGRCYEDLKNYPKAIKAYENWITLTKPEGQKAEIAYNAVNSCKSSLANPFWLKGSELRRDKKYDEAIIELQKALDIYPQYPDALYTLGLTYKGKGDTQKAIATFEKLSNIRGVPWYGRCYNARAFKQLGLIYKKLGDYKRARQNLLRAVTIYKTWINEDKVYSYLSEDIAKIEKILNTLPLD